MYIDTGMHMHTKFKDKIFFEWMKMASLPNVKNVLLKLIWFSDEALCFAVFLLLLAIDGFPIEYNLNTGFPPPTPPSSSPSSLPSEFPPFSSLTKEEQASNR